MALGGQPFGTSNEGVGAVVTLAGDVEGPSDNNVIADDAVTTAKILDGAVTNGKLAPEAVSIDKMAPDSVGTSQLLDDSVDSDKIADGAVLIKGTPGAPNIPLDGDPTTGIYEAGAGAVGISGDGGLAFRTSRVADSVGVTVGGQSDGITDTTLRLATDTEVADLVLSESTGDLNFVVPGLTKINGGALQVQLANGPFAGVGTLSATWAAGAYRALKMKLKLNAGSAGLTTIALNGIAAGYVCDVIYGNVGTNPPGVQTNANWKLLNGTPVWWGNFDFEIETGFVRHFSYIGRDVTTPTTVITGGDNPDTATAVTGITITFPAADAGGTWQLWGIP